MKTNFLFGLAVLALGASNLTYGDTTEVTYTSYTVNADGTVTAVEKTTNAIDGGGDTKSDQITPTEDTSYTQSFYDMYGTSGSANSGGGALRVTLDYTVTVTGDFVSSQFERTSKSTANGGGGALYNAGTTTIYGDFIDNFTSGGNGSSTNVGGGAIYNTGTLDIVGNFIYNRATANSNRGGGAIRNNTGATATITGSFIGNQSNGTYNNGGGAIFNYGTVNLNTYATDANGDDFYTNIYFTGNISSGVSNAIYNTGTVNFNAGNGYKIVVNDGINGTSAGSLNINSGTTYFNNTVSTQYIYVKDGATLVLSSYAGTDDLFGGESIATTSVAASTASIDNSTFTLYEGSTLAFGTIGGESTISFSNNTWVTSGTGASGESYLAKAALDLSGISGESVDFSITLDFSLDSDGYEVLYDALLSSGELDVIFGDTTTLTASYDETENLYSVSNEDSSYSADFTITTNGNSIIIAGTATAVPEPSTYAMIFGALALAFAYYRRRK